MKFLSRFYLTLFSLCLLVSYSSTAAGINQLSSLKKQRWFEVEVILFKQLSDHSSDKELFTPNELSMTKGKVIDLLTPYIQPPIATLKHLLPRCHSQEDTINIEKQQNENLFNLNELGFSSLIHRTIDIDQQSPQNKKTPIYTQYPTSSDMPLCRIPIEFFQQNLTPEQFAHFNINNIPVNNFSGVINGFEQWTDNEKGQITWASHHPYLINKDSLRLNNIVNMLKRSSDYSPLLHIGWRQAGESKRKAKTMKLYAGENLMLDHQEALAKEKSKQQALDIQAILAQRIQKESLTRGEVNLIEKNSNSQVKKEFNDIYQKLAFLENQKQNAITHDENNEESIKRIVTELSYEMTSKLSNVSTNNMADNISATPAPIQDWSLDGLFKLHLDHYLYVNTELNLIEPAKAPLNNISQGAVEHQLTNQSKIISFKQSRRMISGEIHYFDHPDVGMIVQIRRFDPTKPANVAVSQSKE